MRRFLLFIVLACLFVGCSQYRVTDDPTCILQFSHDTLRFDTVFTEQGSATLQLMVYNRNAQALLIDRVTLAEGTAFRVNVDGEQQLEHLTHLQLDGGDSLFVFVRVDIDPTHQNTPVLVSDKLSFHMTTGRTQEVTLEAWGQDVTRLGKQGEKQYLVNAHFTADKPYLITDTLIIQGDLTIDAGATLYMHNGACLYALGNVTAEGTQVAPVVICGDRLDRLFDSVPYRYASGSWNGLYLITEQANVQYQLSYVDILSGNIGLYCYSERNEDLPQLRMDGCRIHNHALYGLVLIHTDALITNSEISNCASYCVYCSGGMHEFVHSTVASYYGYTNIRIQATPKEDAAAVFIDNLSKTKPATNTSFYNSIITGWLPNQLVVATPFDQYYPGTFLGNYLKTDTLALPHAAENTYWQATDTAEVFRNTFYRYKEYVYYNFQLDSMSPAIGIADSLTAQLYPTDRLGVSRLNVRPDAGCYQHE